MRPYPLGIVAVAFRPDPPVRSAERARELGFAHLDTTIDVDPSTLSLPVGCPFARRPLPRWCASGVRATWDETVEAFRAAPGALLEPTARGVVSSNDAARAMVDAVPGLRLLVDTGHVADWGGDPVELLDLAGHIQLRQGRPGSTQLHVDDATGIVDFAAVLERLDQIGYDGLLSVEYFDLPDYGWPLEDPVGWSVDLARALRPILGTGP